MEAQVELFCVSLQPGLSVITDPFSLHQFTVYCISNFRTRKKCLNIPSGTEMIIIIFIIRMVFLSTFERHRNQ